MSWGRAGRFFAWIFIPLIVAIAIFALSFWGARTIVEAAKPPTGLVSDAGWAQAIGAVLAIVVGFAGIIFQVQRQKAEAMAQEAATGRAAHLLAFDALETVSERLDAALIPKREKSSHRLRGNRTNEMVTAMREFEISRIPATMLADFIRLRSRVYAINERITELYLDEKKEPEGAPREAVEAKRYRWLTSAVVVWNEAVGYFDQLEATALGLGATAQPLSKPQSIISYVHPPGA